MRTIRICQFKQNLESNKDYLLDEDGFGHLIRVLRLKAQDSFVVFDGMGNEFEAKLIQVEKNKAIYTCLERIERNTESPLKVELGQVISRGDKMEFTIQKAVELGVTSITPLYSSRCGVKLDEKRAQKKVEQWQKIAIAACEQSGRNVVPYVSEIIKLEQWLENKFEGLSLTLDPLANKKLTELNSPSNLRLLIGSEGGLAEDEIKTAADNGFEGVTLGPRILRTETAALAALAILGCTYGDL